MFINQMFNCTQNSLGACSWSVSPIADIESEMSKILQEDLGNLIRGNKDIKVQGSVQKLFREPVKE